MTSLTGKREVKPEHEVWDDFDPDVLGDAWTLMEYEEFASGFQWSCCKKDIDKKVVWLANMRLRRWGSGSGRGRGGRAAYL